MGLVCHVWPILESQFKGVECHASGLHHARIGLPEGGRAGNDNQPLIDIRKVYSSPILIDRDHACGQRPCFQRICRIGVRRIRHPVVVVIRIGIVPGPVGIGVRPLGVIHWECILVVRCPISIGIAIQGIRAFQVFIQVGDVVGIGIHVCIIRIQGIETIGILPYIGHAIPIII